MQIVIFGVLCAQESSFFKEGIVQMPPEATQRLIVKGTDVNPEYVSQYSTVTGRVEWTSVRAQAQIFGPTCICRVSIILSAREVPHRIVRATYFTMNRR